MEQDIVEKYTRAAQERSLSLSELCAVAGVANSTISRWKKGKLPWGSTLRKLDAAITKIDTEKQR